MRQKSIFLTEQARLMAICIQACFHWPKPWRQKSAASVIYRSLLTSILDRGYTKAYSYEVQYLKKLDTMAASRTDWG